MVISNLYLQFLPLISISELILFYKKLVIIKLTLAHCTAGFYPVAFAGDFPNFSICVVWAFVQEN